MPLRVLDEDGREPASSVSGTLHDPLTHTLRSLAVVRCLGVVARLGLFDELADDPIVDLDELGRRFGLAPDILRMMFDVLTAENYLEFREGGYCVSAEARQWLDPHSLTSVTTALSYSLDHWKWLGELDQITAGGAIATALPDPTDEVGWLRRVRGQFELARLIGDDVADGIDLPPDARSILDLGSAHGWYSAVLCQRNPLLHATVIDRSEALAIGRELVWEAGLDGVVTHLEGDIFTTQLDGPHDAVFCLPLLAGLTDDEALALLKRARSALRPGGLLITLRPTDQGDAVPDLATATSLLILRLSARTDTSTPSEFAALLATARFGAPHVHVLDVAPELSVVSAQAR
jgi:SAM-dependent methyltransferase